MSVTPILDAIVSLKQRIISQTAQMPVEVLMSESTRETLTRELFPGSSEVPGIGLQEIEGLRIVLNNTFKDGTFALWSPEPPSQAKN
jgi:hypothetical protein